jgi:hypothetical protein
MIAHLGSYLPASCPDKLELVTTAEAWGAFAYRCGAAWSKLALFEVLS